MNTAVYDRNSDQHRNVGMNMDLKTENGTPTLPPIPSSEFVLESLAQFCADSVIKTQGRKDNGLGDDNHQSCSVYLSRESSRPDRPGILKKHIIIEVSASGYEFGEGKWSGGGFMQAGFHGMFAFNGERLIPFEGPNRRKNLGEILRAENVQLEQVDAVALARLLNELFLGRQIVIQGAGHANDGYYGTTFNSAKCSSKPTVSGNAKEGWVVRFSVLRNYGGCIPTDPELFEYQFNITSEFEITFHSNHRTIPSKYGSVEIDALILALKDDYYGLRANALELLRQMKSQAAPAIPAIVELLAETDGYDSLGYSYGLLKPSAVNVLSQIICDTPVTPASKTAAAALVPYLVDDKSQRYAAILALSHVHPDPVIASDVIEAIQKIRAKGDSQYIRVKQYGGTDWLALIPLLGSMDPPAEAAIPFLENTIARDINNVARKEAFNALRSIWTALGTESSDYAVSFYLRNLTQENTIREGCLFALSKVNPLPEKVIPTLISMLSDPHFFVRENAIALLGNIGPAARPAIIEILGFGQSQYSSLENPGRYTFDDIARMDPDGSITVPLVESELANKKEFGRAHENALKLLMKIRSTDAQRLSNKLRQHLITSAGISPDGKLVGGSNVDRVMKLWKVDSADCIRTTRFNEKWVGCTVFSPDGKIMAAGGRVIKLWDVKSGRELHTMMCDDFPGPDMMLCFCPNGRLIAANVKETIQLWDVASGRKLRTITAGKRWDDKGVTSYRSVSSFAFSPDGGTLASCADTLKLFDTGSGEMVFETEIKNLTTVTFRSDNHPLAIISVLRQIDVLDAVTGHKLSSLEGHTGHSKRTAYQPGKQILAGCGDDKNIHIWDVQTGNMIRTLTWVDYHPIASEWRAVLSFNGDGSRLISGAGETIKVWDVVSGTEIRTFKI